jgi:hypothetical protein
MATAESWLKSKIEQASGCSAYPLVVPEAAVPPFAMYARSSTDHELSLSGDVRLATASFTVEIYCDSFVDARSAADAVRDSAHNFYGSVDGLTIHNCILTDEKDGSPVFLDGRDVPTYVIEHTYLIRWTE